MTKSTTASDGLKSLVKNALTDKINDRELFMKGVDYSYYYEENGTAVETDRESP